MDTDHNTIRHVTLTGAIVNICLAGFKVSVGHSSGSQALVADGIHSLSDLVTDAVILIGARFWNAKPDSEHPYGHGRIETLVCLAIGFALGAVALGIGWHAIDTLHLRHPSSPGLAALIAAVTSIILKETLFRWTLITGRRIGSRALIANAWHHRTDALSSLPVACAVVGVYLFPNFLYLDHIAAIIVSIMLLRVTVTISWPCISEMLDANIDKDVFEAVESLRTEFPAICEIHKVRSRRVGSALVADLHMLVDANMTVGVSHSIAEELAKQLKVRIPAVQDVTVHVEPIRDANR